MSAAEWTDTYGIHHWRILRSNYRMLAWVGFEPMTTEFCSDALTDWAIIRPWVQLALGANFVQLLQFHLSVQCSRFILAIALVSCHICFKWNLTQANTWVQWNELIHMVFTTEGFLEVAIQSWPKWDLNPQPLNSIQKNTSVVNTIYISSFRCTHVITCARFYLKQMWQLTKEIAEMKGKHWTKMKLE